MWRFFLRPGAAAVLCSVILSPSAQTEVAPFAARYEGQKRIALIDATAQARIELQRIGGHLRYTVHTTVRWALIERRFLDCSVLRIEGGKLWPVEFRHIDETESKHDLQTRFDWPRGKATTVRSGRPPTSVNIAWPTWDPMSFQVALMAAAPQRKAAAVEPYRVVERGRVKPYQVEFAGSGAGTGGRNTYRVVARDDNGEVVLLLLPNEGWQPQRLTIDGVSIDRRMLLPRRAAAATETPTCPTSAVPPL